MNLSFEEENKNINAVHSIDIINEKRIEELSFEIECALENMDIDYFNEFESEINILDKKFKNNTDGLMLINFFTESKKEVMKQIKFDETKKIMKESYLSYGMDEEIAEEEAENFAWQELFEK